MVGAHRKAHSLNDNAFCGSPRKTPTKQCQTSQSSPISGNEEDIKLQVVFHSMKKVQSYQDLREEAENMLMSGKDDLEEGQLDDSFVFANPRGYSTLERIGDLEQQMQRANNREERREKQLERMAQQLAHHTAEIAILKESSEGFRKIRNRFISTYRRDVRQLEPVEMKTITSGNAAAHNGDVIADASLYKLGIRRDIDIFSDLYGISPERAFKLDVIDDDYSIQLLNARATLKAKGDLNISASTLQNLDLAFKDFAAIFEQTDEKPCDNPISSITQAYIKFWEEHRKALAEH
ncbi:hypothetical protein PRK78_004155 [Emydomyces testavorans]|uniref:Uncharacterized protein n=1 Tax=Emydomyces testavorans TaxID=2070801 RepID=A0AAF0DJE6_9EURO|nr:hypothetical protein PRK78_004155 [Emydomyces testavorans]